MPTVSDILSRYGVSSQITSTIEPHRDDDGQWRIKFSGSGAPSVLMDVGGASKLSIELRNVADADLADRLDAVITTAKRYAAGRQ